VSAFVFGSMSTSGFRPEDESVVEAHNRKRARTFAVPAHHLQELWAAVNAQRLDTIRMFFNDHPNTAAHWAQFPEQLNACLRTHARAGTPARCIDSLAALFIDGGVAMLPEDMDAVLLHILSAPVNEWTRKRLDAWAKESPARAEMLLVLATEAHNLPVFQHVLGMYGSAKATRAIWFDAGDTSRRSVLHAVVRWPDAAIRRELLATLLPHCSAAYVTQSLCRLPAWTLEEPVFAPGLAARAIDTLAPPWTLPVALSAIEEAALRADTASLATLLCRAREDALLDASLLACALFTSLRAAALAAAEAPPEDAPVAAAAGREDVTHAHALCATMLMGCMSVRMLLDFHAHLDTLRRQAIAVKARATAPAADRPKSVNSAAAALIDTTAIERVLGSLSKAHALHAAIVKHAKSEEERVAFALAERTQDADAAFEARTRQYMGLVEHSLAMREEMQQLRLEKRVLMDLLDKKSGALRVLSARLTSAQSTAPVVPPRTEALATPPPPEDAAFVQWIADMDAAHADMLALLMPDVPDTVVHVAAASSDKHLGSAVFEAAPHTPTSPTSTRAQAPRYSTFDRISSTNSLLSLHSSDGSMEERFSKLQASAISMSALEERLARLQAPVSVAAVSAQQRPGHARTPIALKLPK
jgi:hypothetical protein